VGRVEQLAVMAGIELFKGFLDLLLRRGHFLHGLKIVFILIPGRSHSITVEV
jgi:hypothetical protein